MKPRGATALAFRATGGSRSRQRGAALLTAMIIVTLVATLAAAMVWQQWRAIQVESAERARTQAAWVLSGALDFARRILREDQKAKPTMTALTEPWATPLAEARLSTFLAADANNTGGASGDDELDAFLSGTITDLQGRFNLANLVQTDPTLLATELAIVSRLCQTAGVDPGAAQRLASGLNAAFAVDAGGAAPLKPQSVAQLAWLGIDATTLQALEPYVFLLPNGKTTPLNVNTASKEVLAAVVDTDPATAERLVQTAQHAPFRDLSSFNEKLAAKTPSTASINTFSNYFEVRGRLRLGDQVLVERSIVQRNADGTSTVLLRERLSSTDATSR